MSSDGAAGKSIRLFLADGTPTGLVTAEIVNWTGSVLVVARTDLAKLAKRPEARRPGVYVLVGGDPDLVTKERVYIGESEDVFKRLLQHDSKDVKDFWIRTALVLGKDENLTKSHIRYLESRIIQESQCAGRVVLDNNEKPDVPSLPEGDIADMEYFLSQVRILLPVLGFNLMRRTPVAAADGAESLKESPLFELAQEGARATMKVVGDEFVVLKDSTARREGRPKSPGYAAGCKQLVDDGVLAPSSDPKLYVFTQDAAFNTPSAAAAAVSNRNHNGRTAWKIQGTGTTYKVWQETRLQEAYLEQAGSDATGGG